MGDVSGKTDIALGIQRLNSTPISVVLVIVQDGSRATGTEFALTSGSPVILNGFLHSLNYVIDSVSGEGKFVLAPTDADHIQTFLDNDFLRRAGMRELVAAGVALQPYVPLYEAYPSVLLDMMAMPSFETRSGGRYDHGEALSSGPALDAVWGRVEGAFSHNDPEDATTGYDTDLSRMELQAGLDGLFLDNDAGTLIASLTGHYKDGEAKVGSPFGGSYDFETGKTRIGLYAELTATTGFDTGSYGYGGNLGLKVRW